MMINKTGRPGFGKTALITGASTGIGYELAHCFAREGYNLILVARNEVKLAELAQKLEKEFEISAKTLAKNLTDPLAPAEIFIELQRNSIFVDILVNNAGVGVHGFFSETELSTELQMMQLNMQALTHLTKLFVREMLKHSRGKILNVASTAAFQPGPLMAVYYATKAYVLSFSQALAEELSGTGISVTCLCPGPTYSEFQKNANIGNIMLLKGRMMTSKAVAEMSYWGLRKNKRVVIAGGLNRVFAWLARTLPTSLVTRVIKILQLDRKKKSEMD